MFHTFYFPRIATYDSSFSYLLFLFFKYFDGPAKFSETAYRLTLPWDNPPQETSFQSNIFVYLDHYYGNNIIAHMEVLYKGSNYTEGQGYGIDVPNVTLTGPFFADDQNLTLNTSGKEIDLILKNSSQYGLEYCNNDLQDEVFGYLPVTVTVMSPQQYSFIANHSFVLKMTFEDMETGGWIFYEDSADFTIIVEEG